MYVSKKEIIRYANAISDEVFGCKVKELTPGNKEILKLNLMVRKVHGEFDSYMFDHLKQYVIEKEEK